MQGKAGKAEQGIAVRAGKGRQGSARKAGS
jgi:hypothetical protein